MISVSKSYSTFLQRQRASAKSSTVRDALILISQDVEVVAFYQRFIPYEYKENKVMTHTYFLPTDYDFLCKIDVNDKDDVSACCDKFGFDSSEMAREYIAYLQLQVKTNDTDHLRSIMVEKKDKPDLLFETSHGNTRTKHFLWMLLLRKFFEVDYKCCCDVKDMLELKQRETMEGDIAEYPPHFIPAYFCVQHVHARSHLLQVKQENKRSYAQASNVVILVALFADCCCSEASLNETRRFLNKLPGCKGDIVQTYLVPETQRFEWAKSPLNGANIDNDDEDFVAQMISNQIHRMVAGFQTHITELNNEIMDGREGDKLLLKIQKNKRVWKPLLFRELNKSWMKIVNIVGALVYPTKYTCPGTFTRSKFLRKLRIFFCYYVFEYFLTIFSIGIPYLDLDSSIMKSLETIGKSRKDMVSNIGVISNYIIEGILTNVNSPFVLGPRIKRALASIEYCQPFQSVRDIHLSQDAGLLTFIVDKKKLASLVHKYQSDRGLGDKEVRLPRKIYNHEFTLEDLVSQLFSKSDFLEPIKPFLSYLIEKGHLEKMKIVYGKSYSFDFTEIGDNMNALIPVEQEEEKAELVILGEENEDGKEVLKKKASEMVLSDEEKEDGKDVRRKKATHIHAENFPLVEGNEEHKSSDSSLANEPLNVEEDNNAGENKEYGIIFKKLSAALAPIMNETTDHLKSLTNISAIGLALANMASLEAAKIECFPEGGADSGSKFATVLKGVLAPTLRVVGHGFKSTSTHDRPITLAQNNSNFKLCQNAAKDLKICYAQVLGKINLQTNGYLNSGVVTEERASKSDVPPKAHSRSKPKIVKLPNPHNLLSHYSQFGKDSSLLKKDIETLSNPYSLLVEKFLVKNQEGHHTVASSEPQGNREDDEATDEFQEYEEPPDESPGRKGFKFPPSTAKEIHDRKCNYAKAVPETMQDQKLPPGTCDTQSKKRKKSSGTRKSRFNKKPRVRKQVVEEDGQEEVTVENVNVEQGKGPKQNPVVNSQDATDSKPRVRKQVVEEDGQEEVTVENVNVEQGKGPKQNPLVNSQDETDSE
jgi:hypothetical protein